MKKQMTCLACKLEGDQQKVKKRQVAQADWRRDKVLEIINAAGRATVQYVERRVWAAIRDLPQADVTDSMLDLNQRTIRSDINLWAKRGKIRVLHVRHSILADGKGFAAGGNFHGGEIVVAEALRCRLGQ